MSDDAVDQFELAMLAPFAVGQRVHVTSLQLKGWVCDLNVRGVVMGLHAVIAQGDDADEVTFTFVVRLDASCFIVTGAEHLRQANG